MKKMLTVLLLLLGVAIISIAEIPNKLVHNTTSYIDDYANLLSIEQEQLLDQQIKEIKKSTGVQISVVTINTLDGYDMADFCNRLAREWGIGQKGKNNGVLICLSKAERKWRIEVGYGLEPYLTDIFTHSTGMDVLVPELKRGNYYEGISSLISSLNIKIVEWDRESKLPLVPSKNGVEQKMSVDWGWVFFWIFSLLTIGLISVLAYKRYHRVKKQKQELEDRLSTLYVGNRKIFSRYRTLLITFKKVKESYSSNISLVTSYNNCLIVFKQLETRLEANALHTDVHNINLFQLNKMIEEEVKINDLLNSFEKVQLRQISLEVKSIEKYEAIISMTPQTDYNRLEIRVSNYQERAKKLDILQQLPHFNTALNSLKITAEQFQELINSSKKGGNYTELLNLNDKFSVQSKTIIDLLSKSESILSQHQSKLNFVREFDSKKSTYRKRFDILIERIQHDDVRNKDIKSQALRKLEETYNDLLHRDISMLEPLVIYPFIRSFDEDTSTLESSVANDIISAQNKREEEVREQKRKEEKRKRDEEDEDRRRRNSSSSYGAAAVGYGLGSTDYGSSSSSSFDSGSSFGGGDFGGGGGGGDW